MMTGRNARCLGAAGMRRRNGFNMGNACRRSTALDENPEPDVTVGGPQPANCLQEMVW